MNRKIKTLQQMLNKTVLLVFLIYFMQGIIHNIGHPVTPKMVEDMGIDNYYFGLYFSAMSLGLLLGSPVWGMLGDKGNKRFYIAIGLIIYSLAQIAFAFIGDRNLMILFRFISGFGVSASVTLIMSHLIENSNPEYRKILLGWYQALFVLGTSVGYFIGGRLPEIAFFIKYFHTFDLRYVFLILAIANLFHALFIFLLLGKEQPKTVTEYSTSNSLKGLTNIKKLDQNLLLFLISLSMITLGAITVSKFIEVYMNEVGYKTSDIGNLIGVTGIVSIISTIFVVPLIVKVKRDFTMMVMIQIFSAFIILVVFRSQHLLTMLYTVFMLYVVFKAVYTPLEQHFISSHATDGKYGTIMGVRMSFYSVGMVLGPLIGGFLYNLKPIYAFDFSAGMFLFGAVILVFIHRNLVALDKK